MDKFTHVDDMWLDVLGSLATKDEPFESRVGWCVEQIGYQAVLTQPDHNFILNARRGVDPAYAAAEFLWYLSGESSVERIAAYAKKYKQFAEGQIVWGAYGNRWHNDPSFVAESQGGSEDQLLTLISLLKQKAETRQAIMTMWNAGDLPHAVIGDHKDIPCTLCLQFLQQNP